MYPVVRRTRVRTVVNEAGDGSTVTFRDADGAVREWELQATGLTGTEWGAVEVLFEAARGRLNWFTLLDPAGNLLTRSEEFSDAVWAKGPQIQLTAGTGDPFGGMAATHVVNAGGTNQTVTQTLAAPGNFTYTLSVWARSAGGASVTLTASTTGGSAAQTELLTTGWRRIRLSTNLNAPTDSVTFGVQLNAGAAVDLFGFQVDPQAASSDYKKTGATGGVIGKARFATDELSVRAQGTDVFDSLIRIVSSEI
jgi:hypothetical protein